MIPDSLKATPSVHSKIVTPVPLLQSIRQRRSIFPKSYSKRRSVAKETVERLLEAASWAPFHGSVPPWRYVVLGHDSMREMQRVTLEYYDRHWKVMGWANGKSGSASDYKKWRQMTEDEIEGRWGTVSFMIAIVMRRQAGSKRMPEWEEAAATAASVTLMHIQASATPGLACYWSSMAAGQIEELTDEMMKSIAETYPRLERLNLSSNKIQHLRPNLSLLGKSLIVLDLSMNRIEIVDHLELLPHLKSLNLSHNRIRSLRNIRKATSLESLDLTHNVLEDPDEIQSLHALRALSDLNIVEGNRFDHAAKASGRGSSQTLEYIIDIVCRTLASIRRVDGRIVTAIKHSKRKFLKPDTYNRGDNDDDKESDVLTQVRDSRSTDLSGRDNVVGENSAYSFNAKIPISFAELRASDQRIAHGARASNSERKVDIDHRSSLRLFDTLSIAREASRSEDAPKTTWTDVRMRKFRAKETKTDADVSSLNVKAALATERRTFDPDTSVVAFDWRAAISKADAQCAAMANILRLQERELAAAFAETRNSHDVDITKGKSEMRIAAQARAFERLLQRWRREVFALTVRRAGESVRLDCERAKMNASARALRADLERETSLRRSRDEELKLLRTASELRKQETDALERQHDDLLRRYEDTKLKGCAAIDALARERDDARAALSALSESAGVRERELENENEKLRAQLQKVQIALERKTIEESEQRSAHESELERVREMCACTVRDAQSRSNTRTLELERSMVTIKKELQMRELEVARLESEVARCRDHDDDDDDSSSNKIPARSHEDGEGERRLLARLESLKEELRAARLERNALLSATMRPSVSNDHAIVPLRKEVPRRQFRGAHSYRSTRNGSKDAIGLSIQERAHIEARLDAADFDESESEGELAESGTSEGEGRREKKKLRADDEDSRSKDDILCVAASAPPLPTSKDDPEDNFNDITAIPIAETISNMTAPDVGSRKRYAVTLELDFSDQITGNRKSLILSDGTLVRDRKYFGIRDCTDNELEACQKSARRNARKYAKKIHSMKSEFNDNSNNGKDNIEDEQVAVSDHATKTFEPKLRNEDVDEEDDDDSDDRSSTSSLEDEEGDRKDGWGIEIDDNSASGDDDEDTRGSIEILGAHKGRSKRKRGV
eukprot:g657.t1